jgi:hypothetical protein
VSKPESCRQAGLECRNCVKQTASNLAGICHNLQIEEVRDSFFKIYPDNACLPMARAFIRAYRAAANDCEESIDDFGLLTASPA